MSRGPFIMPAARWGARLGCASVIDYMNGILHDPFGKFHMGITAENIAERYGITRQMQDELAFESQQRAARTVADGRFASQIVPVELKTRSGTTLFDTDENVRGGITVEKLAGMNPVFRKDGLVTAGHAPGPNGGPAARVPPDTGKAPP